jgi:hypothetical protein
VGYRGWKSVAPIEKTMLSSELDGVLILEGPIFVESDRLFVYQKIDDVETQASLGAHKRIRDLCGLGENVGVIVETVRDERRPWLVCVNRLMRGAGVSLDG